MKRWGKSKGFTIVELLIVIVVIGILAAITLIAYNGIQNRAKVAGIQSDLENSTKLLENFKVGTSTNDQYPTSLAAAGIKSSSGNSLSYIVSNTTNPAGYCVIGDNNGTRYYSTSMATAPVLGSSCGSFNYAPNGSAESGTTCWSASNGGAFEQVTSPVYDGTYSMRGYVTGAGGGDRYIYCNAPASGAGSWNISAQVYLSCSASPDLGRGIWVNDTAGTITNTAGYNTGTINAWQTISSTLTTPSSSSSIWVRLYLLPTCNIFVDNIIVSRT